MRPIPAKLETRHSIVVSEAMTVDFEQRDPRLGKLHPVYATYWLTKHFELVSRKIILPFLEPEEEGIGYALEVTHLSSALPGMRVDLIARFERQEGNRVYASCRAFSELGDLIGSGSTTQVVLPRSKIDSALATLRERWDGGGARSAATPREEKRNMVKVIVLYTKPKDQETFMRHYEEVHAPLVRKLPGLERLVVNRVRGDSADGAPPYTTVAELHFPDREVFKAAMRSPENQAVIEDLQGFAQGLSTILITDSSVMS